MSTIDVQNINSKTGNSAITISDAGDTTVGTFTSTGIDDNATGTAVIIDSSGNVRIGDTIGESALQFNNVGASYAEIEAINYGYNYDMPLVLQRQGGTVLVGATTTSATSDEGSKLLGDGRIYTVNEYSTNSQESLSMYSTGASTYRFYVGWGGTVYATSTSITAISDESLKENIRDLDKGLDTILALQPRRFDWKNGDGNDIMGFIAQEVEEVMPELVHEYKYNAEETKKGLKMGDILPSMVKAIQEQQVIIEELKAKVAALEA